MNNLMEAICGNQSHAIQLSGLQVTQKLVERVLGESNVEPMG